MGIQNTVPVYEHEFKGTYSGEEKGKVKIQYCQIYNKETDISTFKIISINSLSTKYTGEYIIQGKITIAYGESSVSKDLISWNDENPSNDINNVNFTELNTYYELTNNDGTSIELSLEIPNASQTTEPIKIQLSRASETTYGLLFYNNSNDPDGWQVLDEQTSSNDGYAEIDIVIPTDEPEEPAPDEPEELISLELNPKFLFMGWNFARQFDFRRFGSGTDTPVEPVAFIYGTPSESGNIGLRNGESVTLYDGAVLPPLPEWDKETYPYAVIHSQWITDKYHYHLSLCKVEPIAKTLKNGTIAIQSIGSSNGDVSGYTYNRDDDGWRKFIDVDYTYFYSDSFVWANTDLYFNEESGGSLYRATTAPIPVSRIVGHSYNGTVLPPLPEWDKEAYPYAFIDLENAYMEATPIEWKVPTCYIFAKKPYVKYQPDNLLSYYIIVEPPYLVTAIDKTTGKWREIVSGTHSPNRGADWANYDVTADEDTLIIAASEPVPVYE